MQEQKNKMEKSYQTVEEFYESLPLVILWHLQFQMHTLPLKKFPGLTNIIEKILAKKGYLIFDVSIILSSVTIQSIITSCSDCGMFFTICFSNVNDIVLILFSAKNLS